MFHLVVIDSPKKREKKDWKEGSKLVAWPPKKEKENGGFVFFNFTCYLPEKEGGLLSHNSHTHSNRERRGEEREEEEKEEEEEEEKKLGFDVGFQVKVSNSCFSQPKIDQDKINLIIYAWNEEINWELKL